MVIKFKYLLPLLFLICCGKILPQENNPIAQKKSELTKIKEEINKLEDELKFKSAKEKESYAVLDNYNRQSFLLNKLINSIKSEEEKKESEINKSEIEIITLQKNINELKKNYSKYVVAVYKYGKADELESIVNSESVQQAVLRIKYLQKFSTRRRKDLQKLKAGKAKLISLKHKLENEKREKEVLAARKQLEEEGLENKLEERKQILASLKNDKKELSAEIEAKKSAELKIKSIINQLIVEAERRRKEEAERLAREKLAREKAAREKKLLAEAAVKKTTLPETPKPKIETDDEPSYDIDLSTEEFTSFSALKGKMNWPVHNGKVITKFGENKNEKLNTVTLNYGVDIKASNDLNVKAVADGVVSAIEWIPGYGSVLILTHKNDYRTVYSHLSQINVKEGDKVKMGKIIGQIGESLEGNILHFEIWNSRNNQDPEIWLAGK